MAQSSRSLTCGPGAGSRHRAFLAGPVTGPHHLPLLPWSTAQDGFPHSPPPYHLANYTATRKSSPSPRQSAYHEPVINLINTLRLPQTSLAVRHDSKPLKTTRAAITRFSATSLVHPSSGPWGAVSQPP